MMTTTVTATRRGNRNPALTAASIITWLLMAGALVWMAWHGLTATTADLGLTPSAAANLQGLWRVCGGAAALLFLVWIPFLLLPRSLPLGAIGVCLAAAMVAAFDIVAFRPTGLGNAYVVALVALVVGGVCQLALRFPNTPRRRPS